MLKKLINIKSSSLLILGFFLLIWSNNAFVFGGYTLKLISLFVGFLLIVFISFREFKSNRVYYQMILYSFLYFITLWVISIFKHQHIDITGIVFSIIILFLYISGYLLSRNSFYSLEIGNNLISSLLFFTLIGSASFFFKQLSNFEPTLNSDLRNTGEESLNPNGVAFTQALLFLFLFWVSNAVKTIFLRVLRMITLVSVLLIIIMTGARGAMLSLFLVFFFMLFSKLLIYRLTYSALFKGLFVILLSILLFSFIVSLIPILQYKLLFFGERLFSMVDFFNGASRDLSINERSIVYEDFFKNWLSYYIGKENYSGYPHNLFLEIYMRWGVFGLPLIFFIFRGLFLSFYGLFKSQFIPQINQINTNRINLIFLFSLFFIFSFFQAQTSLNIEMNRSLWISLGFFNGYFNKSI